MVKLPDLPEPAYRRLSDLQSGIDDWYSANQMQAHYQKGRADALLDAMNTTIPFGKTGAVIAAAIGELK